MVVEVCPISIECFMYFSHSIDKPQCDGEFFTFFIEKKIKL